MQDAEDRPQCQVDTTHRYQLGHRKAQGMEKGQSDENETQLFCCLCGFGTKPLPPANHKRGGKGMGDGLIPVGHPSPKGLIHTDSLDPSRWAALPLPTLGTHTRGSRIRRKRHLPLQDLICNPIGHAAASCEPVLGPSNEELRGRRSALPGASFRLQREVYSAL
ncbi:hypothetical protein NA56DRAFT_663954 [Hyaloscypha hepaticicola]|uniref:Uncharacterized protein n=1 Tax=Hyaloscypha hepaticicola TaxID=2082293 RepID=A0A2J6PMN6_9HELO|nr:hypothetical protein NA56DRAFT_663954 [Hyaloscypha hepaticicola]